jgi:hypothetical protein
MISGQFIVALSVGNTRTQAGQFSGGALEKSERFANTDIAPIVQAVAAWWKDIPAASGTILLASVNDAVATKLTSALEDQLSVDVYRLGEDVPIPVGQQLDPETITGVDRPLERQCRVRSAQAGVRGGRTPARP